MIVLLFLSDGVLAVTLLLANIVASEALNNKTFVPFSDAVIIGASSVKHLEENLKSTKSGPLHDGEQRYKL